MDKKNQSVNTTNFLDIGNRKLLRANEVAQLLGISLETVYDWKYRSQKRKIPPGMFVKIGKMLFINTVILNAWLVSQIVTY